MSILTNLVVDCAKPNPPGTETDLYYTCSCELNGFPKTKKELGGTDVGDSKILGEAFDFSTAPSGSGYWRKAKILVDSGEVKDILEGEVGGQGFKSSTNFYIKGTDKEQLEFADNMAAASGCIVAMLRDRNGNLRVIGKTAIPATVEAAEGTTATKNGEKRGFAWTISAATGLTAPIYDDATHGIDVQPNA
jgi:hypothetical protein